MERDRIAHDKRAKELTPLSLNQKVLIWDKIKECWNRRGIVAEIIENSPGRSYKILSQGSYYTRNRRHIRPDIPESQHTQEVVEERQGTALEIARPDGQPRRSARIANK